MSKDVPDWPVISAAIKRAERQSADTRKRQMVYRKGGKIFVIAHAAYRSMNLGIKGAEPLCTIG